MVAPHKKVDDSPLDLSYLDGLEGTARFVAFAERELITPKGHGAGEPFRVHDFQRDLVASVFDAEKQPRQAGSRRRGADHRSGNWDCAEQGTT